MYTIQLRNLPKEIYDGVKESAIAARRSMTQQVIYLIEKGLLEEREHIERKNKKKEAIESIIKLGPAFQNISEDEIVRMIREDRDR